MRLTPGNYGDIIIIIIIYYFSIDSKQIIHLVFHGCVRSLNETVKKLTPVLGWGHNTEVRTVHI